MEKFEILPIRLRERFEVRIDYVLVHCDTCDNHWGVSLANREDQFLTARDLVCQKCAADKQALNI